MATKTKMLIDNADQPLKSSPVPLKTKKSTSPHYKLVKDIDPKKTNKEDSALTEKKTGGTQGTAGTITNIKGSACSTKKNSWETKGTSNKVINLDDAINPTLDIDDIPLDEDDILGGLKLDDLEIPIFLVRNKAFLLDDVKRRAGVYWCGLAKGAGRKSPDKVALWICSPLQIDSITNTEDGKYFGRLLRFIDTLGRERRWAMPMELLRGSCEELRGELLAAGVLIDPKNRTKLPEYILHQLPKSKITAATRTGWSQDGESFVFYDAIVGNNNIFFQSESLSHEGIAKTGGDYKQWQELAVLCTDNPVLMVSICVSLAGALLAKTHQDSGGVHLLGDSSIGKSTALSVGASVWGDNKFKRTWRATSNGMEGIAALLNDTCLCLDEVNEADPKDIGAIIYSLGNGIGKTRATRTGLARSVHRWRLSLLSTGERSINALMQEGGKKVKSGQLVRLLNIPVSREYGVFDNLHHFSDGREMADYFKTQCVKHYGHAGVKFVEHIIAQGDVDYYKILAKLEPHFKHNDPQAMRVASRFALYALAGEVAVAADILPWEQGSALTACIEMFDQWLKFRGSDATEQQQILSAVSDYILKYGDTKFTQKYCPVDEKPKLDRSGWWLDANDGRVYMFTSEGLREAGAGFDFNRILDALETEGWITEHDKGRRSKKTYIAGSTPNLYWIKPKHDD
jgi:putative DNA primase/helicase